MRTFIIGAFLGMASSTVPAQQSGTTPPTGMAVVELFTSEGCSSCPPADAALRDLVEQAQREGWPVHVLSFHVDYWNRLGWKDRFSDPMWSARQRLYAARTGDGVYTPQLVVNGQRSFVGSDAQELQATVRQALDLPAPVTITATGHLKADALQVDYQLSDSVRDAKLNLALIESDVATEVRAGENRGRHLSHSHVVRELRIVALEAGNKEGTVTFSLKDLELPAKAQVVLFVQERDQGRILGATSVGSLGE
jgi:hypothetical protein